MARIHRSAAQWQYFIELWQASGQSAAQFCKTHDLGYVSFCKWRQRLEANEQQHPPWLITSCRSANNIMPITNFLPALTTSFFYSA
jgi:hypothetical protein